MLVSLSQFLGMEAIAAIAGAAMAAGFLMTSCNLAHTRSFSRGYRLGLKRSYRRARGRGYTLGYEAGYADCEQECDDRLRRYEDRLVHYFINPGDFHADRHLNYFDRGITFPPVPGRVGYDAVDVRVGGIDSCESRAEPELAAASA